MHTSLSLHCFFTISLFLAVSNSYAMKTHCSDDERDALLNFKQSFIINEEASSDPLAYPKVVSWNYGKDCCSWDGVECDEDTGNVVGLDLHSSCLYGSMDSSSSLFRLVHLQSLDLADNHFNYSQIPSEIHHLSKLRYVNLSMSVFSGQIPLEMSKLSNLTSLDLSFNGDSSRNGLMELRTPNLKRLVPNLTRLEILDLSYMDISSTVAHISLRSLVPINFGLIGMFPAEIFLLPNLEVLNLEHNQDLKGHLPEFPLNTSLQILRLGNTSFSGGLPESIGNLSYLTEFSIQYCNFSGLIPSSIGGLSKLTYLRIEGNKFTGDIPSSIANLKELTHLSFSFNNLTLRNLLVVFFLIWRFVKC